MGSDTSTRSARYMSQEHVPVEVRQFLGKGAQTHVEPFAMQNRFRMHEKTSGFSFFPLPFGTSRGALIAQNCHEEFYYFESSCAFAGGGRAHLATSFVMDVQLLPLHVAVP